MTEKQILKAIKETTSYKMSNYRAMKIESLTQTSDNEYIVALSFKAKKYENNGVEYKLIIDENDKVNAYFEKETYTA